MQVDIGVGRGERGLLGLQGANTGWLVSAAHLECTSQVRIQILYKE